MTIQFRFLTQPGQGILQQILDLYKSAQWWEGTDAEIRIVEQIVTGSHCFLVVLEDGTLIGMGRAISDGVSDAYIQDVTVAEAFRKKMIGTQIVERLIQKLQHDGIGWIGLVAERGTAPFYEKIGFKPMKNASPMLKVF